MIYLDYAAHTPTDSEVLKTFCEINQDYIGNPNANHSAGHKANEKMDKITGSIAKLLGVQSGEIIYTSGASESNNLAIKGFARSNRHVGRHIISTCLEHSSVSGALSALQEQGYEIELVDIRRDGTIDLEHLRELLRNDTVLVSVCAVDSELGVRQPIAEISEILCEYPNCCFHVDATQAIGKIPVSFDGVDSMSFSPHKFYGLVGCGILVKREGLVLEPLIHGGKSTTIYRSGTPAVALAASIEKALDTAICTMDERLGQVQKMSDYLKARLLKYPCVRINSTAKSIPYILNLSVKGSNATTFQQALDAHGVCVSTKSACSVPSTPSRAVFAVSHDKKNALASWRISLSHLTTENELSEFLQIFDLCYRELTK